MLQSRVWSSDEMADHLKDTFVPVKLDGTQDRDTMDRYEVRAYPTIIIAESDGTTVVRQVGTGGMTTPGAWKIWIDEQLGKESDLDRLAAAVEENPEDVEALRALADACYELGRGEEASEYYARLEKLIEEDLLQVKLRRAELMLPEAKDDPAVREAIGEIIPKLIEDKDERVIRISLQFANVIGRMGEDKDPAKARRMMLDLAEAFPEHDQLIQFRCMAGMYAHMDGDDDTAIKEMKEIAEEYKDSDDRTIKAWVTRCERFIKRLEEGGVYR